MTQPPPYDSTNPYGQQFGVPGYPPPPNFTPPTGRPPRKRVVPVWVAVLVGAVALVVGIAAGSGGKTAEASKTKTATIVNTATAISTVTTTPTIVKTQPIKTKIVTKTYTPPPQNQFTDGTQLVGTDIPAGTYKTDGKGDSIGCYYAILNSSNNLDIASNDNFDGPTRVELASGKYFQTSGGCTWQRVG